MILATSVGHGLLAGNITPATITFDMNACQSDNQTGTNIDYSELTAAPASNGAVLLQPGISIYRQNPTLNPHSCTIGPDGTPAMCIAVDPFCDYIPGSPQAIRFEVLIEPLLGEPVRLEELTFMQQAPEMFSWIDGTTASNNYPTKFGVRILLEGEVIYIRENIPTSQDWLKAVFDLEEGIDRIFYEPTILQFELLPYCAAGVVGFYSIWDLDNIQVSADCVSDCAALINGGRLTLADGNEVYYGCPGNATLDIINDSTMPADEYYYLVADSDFNIVQVIPSTQVVDLSNYAIGQYSLYGYSDQSATGLVGTNISEIINSECGFLTSNSITVLINQAEGGTLTGGPINFCTTDATADHILPGEIMLSGEVGDNSIWVVTDADQDMLLFVTDDITSIDFSTAPTGVCYIYHLTFYGWLKGLETGLLISDLEGADNSAACYDLSNPIMVTKEGLTPSMISGGPFTFCIKDGIPDILSEQDVNFTPGSGSNGRWVVTNGSGSEIYRISDNLSSFDFNDNEGGNCLLWYIDYNQIPAGLEVGGNLLLIEGCYGLSAFITIFRNENSGGTLTGGPFEFCARDGIADHLMPGQVILEGNLGTNSQWILLDMEGTILELPDNDYTEIDFEDETPGVCRLIHMSYDGSVEGLKTWDNIADVTGCFSLSTEILIVKLDCTILESGVATGGPFSFCASDGDPDLLTGVTISGNDGENNQWVLATVDGTIIDLVADPGSYNVEGSIYENCILLHVTYDGAIMGLEVGRNVFTDVDGIFVLSNSISISKVQPAGGQITGGPFVFCVGDGAEDRIEIGAVTLENNVGSNGAWIATDIMGSTILAVGTSPNDMDFDEAGGGNCLLQFVSYEGMITGLEVGAMTNMIDGCYDVSNTILVMRNIVSGGTLGSELGYFQFCVGDGIPDRIPAGALTLSDNIGDNHTWVITDVTGTDILELPDSPYDVDFENSAAGTCVLWNVSSIGPVTGLEIGGDVTGLDGCASTSNFVSIFRFSNTGGTLTGGPFVFCSTDGLSDRIPDGSVSLTGNSGANSQWIVTDASGTIVRTPLNSYADIEFEGEQVGSYSLVHLSYDGPISGLQEGMPLSGLDGCFSLSTTVNITLEACPQSLSGIVLDEVQHSGKVMLKNTDEKDISMQGSWMRIGQTMVPLESLERVCGEGEMIPAGKKVTLDLSEFIEGEKGELSLYKNDESQDEILMAHYVVWGNPEMTQIEEAIQKGLWNEESMMEMGIDKAIRYKGYGYDAESWEEVTPTVCQSTGLSDEIQEESIDIYPNPTLGMIHVNASDLDVMSVEITSGLGEEIMKTIKTESIDVSFLSDGIYIMMITTERGVVTKRFVKE